MPNPFRDAPVAQEQAGVVKITNSSLFCEDCFHENDHGDYYESKNILKFKCISCGRMNEVEIEL